MEIFYNELSNKPLASNKEEARNRVLGLLNTMKSLREYDINIMRTHNDFFAEQLSDDYTMGSFFGDTEVSYELKLLLKTITANPFIEDDDSYEAEMFVTNTFSTKNEVNQTVNPEGLASAYVFNSPTISIGSHEHWRNEYLTLSTISVDNPQEVNQKQILNVFSENCVNNEAFQEWIAYLNPPVPLNSKENISIVFPANTYEFETKAIKDIISWFYDDKRYLIRVKELIEDIERHPFQGGKGKTEPLSGTGGKASKRIVKKDRVIYTYTAEKITVHQCRGHYDDK